MADDVDLMLEREQIYHEQLLKVRKPEGPVANGFCHSCEEPVPEAHRWCDRDCRDDYERSFLSTRY